MKNKINSAILFLAIFLSPLAATAQQQQPSQTAGGQAVKESGQSSTESVPEDKKEAAAATTETPTTTAPAVEAAKPDQQQPSMIGRRTDKSEEDAAILPYYNNFFSTYRLGPEDVISVSVFGLERYSQRNILIPPDGRIAYPLIPEGIMVAGKTTQDLQAELTKKLDEFIIDPKVTVSLDRAGSARYSILGDVRTPGVKPMLRRMTVHEALSDAGGILDTGSKKNVYVLRRQVDGNLAQIPVNISKIEKGKAPDIVYLAPGDQIIVPGNTFKKVREALSYASLARFAMVFIRWF